MLSRPKGLSGQWLKVRYSQMFNFSYHTPTQRDTFIQWLLSEPIIEKKPTDDEEQPPASPADDTAPQLTASTAVMSPPATSCRGELQNDLASTSMGATVLVA